MAEQIMGQPNRAAYERQFGRSGVLQKTRDAGSRKVSKMYQLAMGRLNFGSSKSDSMCESLAAFDDSQFEHAFVSTDAGRTLPSRQRDHMKDPCCS